MGSIIQVLVSLSEEPWAFPVAGTVAGTQSLCPRAPRECSSHPWHAGQSWSLGHPCPWELWEHTQLHGPSQARLFWMLCVAFLISALPAPSLSASPSSSLSVPTPPLPPFPFLHENISQISQGLSDYLHGCYCFSFSDCCYYFPYLLL